MKKALFSVFVFMLALHCINVYAANEIAVETAPPVVVKTFPAPGDTAVDPATKEISVTFSKDMQTNKMWSWVIASPESFPNITGKVYYLDDQRTCVAPVKLEPNKTYAIWFNSPQYNNFRDKNNTPAVPYLLVFKTAQ